MSPISARRPLFRIGLSFATFGSAEVGGGEAVDVGDEGDTVDVRAGDDFVEGEVGEVTCLAHPHSHFPRYHIHRQAGRKLTGSRPFSPQT